MTFFGCLKSAMIGVFTPQELVNVTHQGFLFLENQLLTIQQHATVNTCCRKFFDKEMMCWFKTLGEKIALGRNYFLLLENVMIDPGSGLLSRTTIQVCK